MMPHESIGLPGDLSGIGAGEAVLLAYSPIFKVRYASDGDLLLGCRIGCSFCYYRMISSTEPFIGTGRLARLATPRQFVEMIVESKLLEMHPLVILGARGDASMYPEAVTEVLEISEREGVEKLFLALRRAPFDGGVAEQLLSYGDMLRYGTTITPKARATGTPVSEWSQLSGLERAVSHGVDPYLISIELGPITPRNLDGLEVIIRRLAGLGFENVIYRGVSVGSYGIPIERIVSGLRKTGFLTEEQAEKALRSKDYFYAIKNHLRADLEREVEETIRMHGLNPCRHTGIFYSSVWKIPVAINRGNRTREDVARIVAETSPPDPGGVGETLEYLGYNLRDVEVDGFVVTVDTDEPITEDVAMTAGARHRVSLLAKNYVKSPTLDELRFYIRNRVIVPPAENLRKIEEVTGLR